MRKVELLAVTLLLFKEVIIYDDLKAISARIKSNHGLSPHLFPPFPRPDMIIRSSVAVHLTTNNHIWTLKRRKGTLKGSRLFGSAVEH